MRIGIDARLLEGMRGGPARYVVNMLKLWPQMRDNHEFVLYFKDSIPSDSFLNHPKITCKLVRCPKWLNHFIIWEHVVMPFFLRKENIDLYFSPWYMLPWRFKCPKKVVAAWDISYTTNPEMYKFIARKYFTLFSKSACKKADGVITCSYFDGRQIEKYYSVPHNRICVVQLAPDDRFMPLQNRESVDVLRQKYKLPPKYLLSLGSIYSRRHIDVIVEAFKRVRADYPDVGLVIVGKNLTVPRIDINALIAPLMEEGVLVYMTRLPEEDLVPMFNGALWFICVSTCDGETIILKEAMRCGTPVITSPLLKEATGECAVIIDDPRIVDQVELGLRQALGTDQLRDKLSVDGLEWVKRFNWHSIAQKSLEFIESR